MLLTPHAFVGTVIGVSIKNPFVAIPLAFLSHFILDVLPHWNPRSKYFKSLNYYPLYIADLFISLGLGVILSYKYNFVVFACVIAAILPDLLQIPIYILNSKFFLFKFINKLQKKLQFHVDNVYIGLVSQTVVILLSLVFLLRR